jgi:CubicO group peptidase (beta-lactamase class C family)
MKGGNEKAELAGSGLSPERLRRLSAAIRKDVEDKRYDGAAVIVARHGAVGFQEAIGFAHRATNRPCRIDDVFNILSASKAFTDVIVLSHIERGDLALTTRVVDIIPEFKGKVKEMVTVFHLMTHTAGSPQIFFPVEGHLLGNFNLVIETICQMGLAGIPGKAVSYSALWGHALLGEMVRRVDGGKRALRDIFQDELFGPLQMKDTALGRRRDLSSRIVPIVAADKYLGVMTPEQLEGHNALITENAEMPWMGCVSSAPNLFRFAEMLRRGGELDGVRILSPTTIELATTIHTGTMVNEFFATVMQEHGWAPGPANLGLDFGIRGEGVSPSPMGLLTSPRTFSKFGLGGTGFWVDPERDVTFVFLSAGLLEEYNNRCRLQRLSDMAMAAVI